MCVYVPVSRHLLYFYVCLCTMCVMRMFGVFFFRVIFNSLTLFHLSLFRPTYTQTSKHCMVDAVFAAFLCVFSSIIMHTHIYLVMLNTCHWLVCEWNDTVRRCRGRVCHRWLERDTKINEIWNFVQMLEEPSKMLHKFRLYALCWNTNVHVNE